MNDTTSGHAGIFELSDESLIYGKRMKKPGRNWRELGEVMEILRID